MTKNDIIKYVMDTPENTNPSVLQSMLENLEPEGGASGQESGNNVKKIVIEGKNKEDTTIPEELADFSNEEIHSGEVCFVLFLTATSQETEGAETNTSSSIQAFDYFDDEYASLSFMDGDSSSGFFYSPDSGIIRLREWIGQRSDSENSGSYYDYLVGDTYVNDYETGESYWIREENNEPDYYSYEVNWKLLIFDSREEI